MPYPVSVALSLLHTTIAAGAAYFLLVIALLPWENQDDPTSNDWLVPVAGALFLTALAMLVLVLAKRRVLGRIAFAAHLIVAIPLYVLVEIDDDSNGKLFMLTLGVELVGLLAVASRPRARPPQAGADPHRL